MLNIISSVKGTNQSMYLRWIKKSAVFTEHEELRQWHLESILRVAVWCKDSR
ncbi:hypothetical protein LguiB_012599 [Lonicera macranthoides]